MNRLQNLQGNLPDYHRFIIVIAGVLAHVQDLCVLGLCAETLGLQCRPNFASAIFILAISWLVSEYDLWPATLKKPAFPLVILFEILTTLLLTNLAYAIIWCPFVQFLAYFLVNTSHSTVAVNQKLGYRRHAGLYSFSRWLQTECALNALELIVSTLSLAWVLDAVDLLDDTWDFILIGFNWLYANVNKIYDWIREQIIKLAAQDQRPQQPALPQAGAAGQARGGPEERHPVC